MGPVASSGRGLPQWKLDQKNIKEERTLAMKLLHESQKDKESSKKYRKKQEKLEAEERKKRNHELLQERILKNQEREAAREALKQAKERNGEEFEDDSVDDFGHASINTELDTILDSLTGVPTVEDKLLF